MKRIVFLFGILIPVLLFPVTVNSQFKVQRVVIDAGHGGKDPGASGKNSKEKDIALSIALKTGNYIEENIPGVEVIYTRKSDVFIELHKRAKIANDSKADMFISIHCNANRSVAPYGCETYVMGLHKSEANLEVAKLENAAILKEENYSDMYEGFDPVQDEDYITLTMFQDAFLDQSTIFADKIQSQFRDRVKRNDRGVNQAGFLVLYKTAMPGVLIETGFITNPKEEQFLRSEDGQAYMASAIYRAFKDYKQEIEREDNKAKSVLEYTDEEKPDVKFRIQIASYKKSKPANHKKFKGFPDVMEYHHDGMYKYTTGNFDNFNEAMNRLNEIQKNNKHSDAFLVAFQNGERISTDNAQKLLKK